MQWMGGRSLGYVGLTILGEIFRVKESGAAEGAKDAPARGRRAAELGWVHPGHLIERTPARL
jgi:hypothetical protein